MELNTVDFSMEETLFSFEVEKTPVTTEELKNWKESVSQIFLLRGNPVRLSRMELLSSGLSEKAIRELSEYGVLEISQSSEKVALYALKDDCYSYYGVDEVLDALEEEIHQLLITDGKPFYESFQILNFHTWKYPYKRTRANEEYYQTRTAEMMKSFALTLGLEHFLSVPKSRGTKMNRFNSSFAKKETIPKIAEDIIPMTTYDEIKAYFDRHAVFAGRRGSVPYPDYLTVRTSPLILAALVEAKDVKTIALILSYTGGGWARGDESKYQLIYPDGWSYERYMESLTLEDIGLIVDDTERLKRLWGKSYFEKN